MALCQPGTSLRGQLLAIMVALVGLTTLLLAWREVDGTRRSVHEEIAASSRVAVQILQVVEEGPADRSLALLQRMGRVRATELSVYDTQGVRLYTSPPSRYKAGRDAPAWFAALVSPSLAAQVIALPGARLEVRPDPSRAIVDGWDDFVNLMACTVPLMVALTSLATWAVLRALRPLAQVEQALRGLQRGELGTRLPALAGREAALMSQAFNDMAQAIQDNLHARDEARAAQASLAHNREFTQVILQRVEAERARIARDLHDELGQQLTAARTVARLLAQDAHLTQHKAPLVDLLDRATAAMQDHLQTMLPRLRPLALDRLGLHDALQDLVQDWRRLAPQTRFSLDTSRLPAQLGDSVATAVYRIAQEAVTNAMRHAQPTHIALELAVRPTGLCVIVSDDGPGLPQAWQRPGHHGLSGICERAQALGGRVDFLPTHEGDTTRPGLTLLVTLPWGTHA